MLKQLNQWSPQAEGLQVIRIINTLDHLLEVVECDQFVLQVRVVRVEHFHGSLHEIGIGGTAHERIDHVWGQVALEFFGAGGGSEGAVLILLLGVLDTPFEELVHFGIHLGVIGDGIFRGEEVVEGIWGNKVQSQKVREHFDTWRAL